MKIHTNFRVLRSPQTHEERRALEREGKYQAENEADRRAREAQEAHEEALAQHQAAWDQMQQEHSERS